MPKGYPRESWTEQQIIDACLNLIDGDAEDCFGLDDALWCYAYEPRCQKARQMVYKACGVKSKDELIDWDTAHSHADRIEALAALARYKEGTS